MKKEIKIYYVRESAFQSILSDIFSFGMIAVMLTFNSKILEGNGITTIFFLIFALIILTNRGNNKMKIFNTNEELIKYLNDA